MKDSATETRKMRTFSSSAYLGKLMAELDRASICGRIAQAREEAGLTQPELGEALSPPVHWRTIQTWESLKQPRVPWDRLDEIARVTGRTKEWLLHGREPQAEDPDVVERLDRIERLLETLVAPSDRAGREGSR